VTTEPAVPAPCLLTDDEIIRLAGSPKRKNGAGRKFADLFEGRWDGYFGSASEADSSPAGRWRTTPKTPTRSTGSSAGRACTARSGDERHGRATYGALTIRRPWPA
jgi:primase-polymerase (primpol)-like protein